MGKRFIAAWIVAALVMAAGAVSLPAPSSADVLSPAEVSGNFAGDAREEVYMYVAGTAPDHLVSFSRQGAPCSPVTWTRYPHNPARGTHYPLAGDFDVDPLDEMIWHGPGGATDYKVDFSSFSSSTAAPLVPQVGGDYVPLAGDFSGDDAEDVIWYARGGALDYWWDYNSDGSFEDLTLPRVNSFIYRPVAGSFGMDATDDLHWYAPGPALDYFWDFIRGTHDFVQSIRPVNGENFEPFSLDIYGDGWQGEDIFWYDPGPGDDHVWDYIDGSPNRYVDPAPDNHRPTAGDYFNDGHDDILWTAEDGSFILWDHYPAAGGNVDRCIYTGTFPPTEAGTGEAGGTPSGPVERADR